MTDITFTIAFLIQWAIVDVNESSLNLHDQKATRDGLSIKYGEVREHQIHGCVNMDEKSNSIDLPAQAN